jgi:hypothetical protein
LEINKKRKFRKSRYFWILGGLAAVILISGLLLFYKPAYSIPPETIETTEVSPYLTHILLPRFYNGMQRNEPFDMAIAESGVNDIIVRSQWPKEIDGLVFMPPKLFFLPDNMVLVTTMDTGRGKFVITIIIQAVLDEKGLLNLQIQKIKAGAVNITLLAKAIARKLYQITTGKINTSRMDEQIAASLLDGVPFEPVIEIDDKKVRIQKITIEQGDLKLRLIPMPN